MQVLSKAIRATQLYLPNNPVYQRAVDNIRAAFRQIWQATDDLVFDVGETELRWEDNVVYSQDQRNESIAWTLFKDGVRSLTFRPGVEETEIVRFLGVLQQARNLQADAPDDLLTLLWAQDFQFVAYTFRELASENAVPIEKGDTIPSAAPPHVRQQVQDEAPPKREGLVSIDEAAMHPTEEELAELFQELSPEALPTLMGWIAKLHNERVKDLVQAAAARLAQANPGEVLKALGSEDGAAQLEMVKLAGRLKLPGAPDGMEPLLASGDRALKLAVVEALTAIASPSGLRLLERAIDDDDRDVRIAAVRFVASRGYRNAAGRVEAIVSGSKLRNADLTEKMAFFEAYGALVGAKGIAALDKLLVAKGLLGKREDPETRACAAMALGKIRTPEARAVLERAAQDKEPLVRNAVTRALREVGA